MIATPLHSLAIQSHYTQLRCGNKSLFLALQLVFSFSCWLRRSNRSLSARFWGTSSPNFHYSLLVHGGVSLALCVLFYLLHACCPPFFPLPNSFRSRFVCVSDSFLNPLILPVFWDLDLLANHPRHELTHEPRRTGGTEVAVHQQFGRVTE
ncbi:hypothetical protein V8C43DRAFT_72707 [Trichoderma afarasin]